MSDFDIVKRMEDLASACPPSSDVARSAMTRGVRIRRHRRAAGAAVAATTAAMVGTIGWTVGSSGHASINSAAQAPAGCVSWAARGNMAHDTSLAAQAETAWTSASGTHTDMGVVYADASPAYTSQPFTILLLSGRNAAGQCLIAWLTSPDQSAGTPTGLTFRAEHAVANPSAIHYIGYLGQIDMPAQPSGSRSNVSYTEFLLAAPGYATGFPNTNPEQRPGEVAPASGFDMKVVFNPKADVTLIDAKMGPGVMAGPVDIGP